MNRHKQTNLKAAKRAVELLGGPVAAMKKLGLKSHQTVQSWTRHRIPAEYCPRIERLLNGGMTCEQMRADIDWAYLRNTQA